MELITLTVSGFKRFRKLTNIKLKGKMTAIVGPNEAGKSSLLEAIKQLDHDNAIPKSFISRGQTGKDTKIVGRYFVAKPEIDDCGLLEPSWLTVTKQQSGERIFEISPPPPIRDTKERKKLLDTTLKAFRNPKLRKKIENLDETDIDFLLKKLARLSSYGPDLDQEKLEELSGFADLVKQIIDEDDSKYIVELAQHFDDVLELEARLNPTDEALSRLKKLFPRILFFDQQSRDLKSNYSLEELASSKPTDALGNLCDVAKIKLASLQEALSDPDPSSAVRTILNAANRALREIYEETWGQSGVSVSLNFHNESLDIQVENKDGRLTPLAERSDGLRQFVALQSFSNADWRKNTVLLIDEAEQKLHYDAQADLVQMLVKQQVAAKVVYTTHSAGCLPEDLGNGVRQVVANDDEYSSRIINNFWADNEVGLTPLLFGMGATTLAFFPMRKAVIVEGPSDMLLYPSMFKEALEQEHVGFQFVPGLSESEKKNVMPVITKEGLGVAYLLDGDGIEMEEHLKKQGVSASSIFKLTGRGNKKYELEDFLDTNLIVRSANAYIEHYYADSDRISHSDLKADNRMDSLERAFKKKTKSVLSKVELAYYILEEVYKNPSALLLDAKRRKAFVVIAKKINSHFEKMQSGMR